MNKTKKSHNRLRSCQNKQDAATIIAENFMEMLNEVKIYHWNTHSYSQHKATDELYAQLNEHVDKFVEVMLGKGSADSKGSANSKGRASRLKNLSNQIPLHASPTTISFRDKILAYRDYLIQMDKCLNSKDDTDLLNIRDEILADLNQFLYLLTLTK